MFQVLPNTFGICYTIGGYSYWYFQRRLNNEPFFQIFIIGLILNYGRFLQLKLTFNAFYRGYMKVVGIVFCLIVQWRIEALKGYHA